MSYIISSTNPFVSVKLTEKGRERIAMGALNFSFWAIGDSEIDYNREVIVDNNQSIPSLSGSSIVLRPKDRQPDIKYFISNGSNFLNEMSGNVRTVKAIVNNEADTRGFFSGTTDNFTTLTSNEYVKKYGVISSTSLTGGTTANISTGITVNDYIMVKITNDTLGSLSANTNNIPSPNLFYKVTNVNSSNITVDRELPNFSGTTPVNIQYYVYPSGEVKDAFGTGTTSAYWDTGTLSFVANSVISSDDNPVWCMNNVWSEDIAGVTGLTTNYEDYKRYGSYNYLGQKETYFEFGLEGSTATTTGSICDGYSSIDAAQKALSLIHYTNNTISNFYGEFFHVDYQNGKYVQLYLPTLMYHRRSNTTGSGDTMGMKFIATGSTQKIGDSTIEYIDLIEDPSMVSGKTPLTIGRVYPQLKMLSIHDEEIIAATSYKSNRNWTLPILECKTKAPDAGLTNGALGAGKTIYITYVLENNSGSGLTTSLPCQKYSKVTNLTQTSKDIEFILEDVDLLPYMRKVEKNGYDGKGFYADTFKLLYQILNDDTTRPSSDAWICADFTTSAITTNVGETIDPSLLESQTPSTIGFILTNAIIQANSGNTYSLNTTLNMPLNSTPNELNFGDERFFYGNIDTYIGATIYKTIFGLNISNSIYNTTSNPTYIQGTNMKITEVGIYDSTQELVGIGKLSEPVQLANNDTIMIEMSIDF